MTSTVSHSGTRKRLRSAGSTVYASAGVVMSRLIPCWLIFTYGHFVKMRGNKINAAARFRDRK